MNDAVNPVKMYAYALLGKPIVSTCVRELAARPDIAHAAATPADFAAAITTAAASARNPVFVSHLQSFALENTWRHRARLAWQTLSPRLLQVHAHNHR
jgi:hypothetical protein